MATNDRGYNGLNRDKDTQREVCDPESVYDNHIVVQQLERFSEEYRSKNGGQYPLVENGYTQPEPYAAYVLECKSPNAIQTVDERMREKRGYSTKQMRKAFHSWKRFYVGATSGIKSRLLRHLNGDGALFTGVFQPLELREISWCQSYQDASDTEESLAAEYERKYPDAFVWQN